MASTNTSVDVRVEGLRDVVRSLEQFGVSASDLKAAFTKVGELVATDARSLAPTVSGALAASIKPSRTKNKSVIRAGAAKVPYAGVQEYGGYHGIEAHGFMRGAIERNQGEVMSLIDDELGDLITRYGLK